MFIEVTKSVFIDEFNKVRPDNFSYSGLCALFDFLEETNPDMELDVIAICCDFSEYDDVLELAKEYGEKFDNGEDALEWLNENTIVIEHPSGVIIQDF